MQKIAKQLFFFTLIMYILIFVTLPYVSVYYTYVALPILVFAAFVGFTDSRTVYKCSIQMILFSFVITIITMLSVSYIGVYLILIECIVVSVLGTVAYVSKTKNEN